MSDLAVTLATPGQAGLVTALLTEASAWLAEQGVEQWPHPFPDRIVRAFVDRQDTYLAWLDGGAIGSLAVYWADPTFWGDQPPDAGYVHRLVITRAAGGRGHGARLLDWAADHVRSRGRQWLRLDCNAENAPLRTFYERLGFRHVDDVEVTGPGAGTADVSWRASRYQRRVLP
jgi:GNAT superfamily N-acetyltransferase